MIFAHVRAPLIAQIGEQVRIFGSESIINDFEDVQQIEIRPDVLEPYFTINHQNDLRKIYLDWIYSDAGVKVCEIKITDINSTIFQNNFNIQVLTNAQDNLFSNDDDLLNCEPDIFRYLPDGKNNFNYIHREAQRRIIAWLDEQRIWKSDGNRYEKSDIVDLEEFRHWSKYLSLSILFESLIVSPNDIFDMKARKYNELMQSARRRASIRLEFDENNNATKIIDRVTTLKIRR